MKAALIFALFACCRLFAAEVDYSLSFTGGTTTADSGTGQASLQLHINTSQGSVAVSGSGNDARIQPWLALFGSGPREASFNLVMAAGFSFDPSTPTYDSTPYPDAKANTLRFRVNKGVVDGVAPTGVKAAFGSADDGKCEILHFTIHGLDAGQQFVLTGYTLKNNDPQRIGLYYGGALERVETTTAVMDLQELSIVLGNDDQFGFAYEHESGNRSALQEIRFRIISSTGETLGLITS